MNTYPLRVHIICEGQTEEMFVRELLQSVFFNQGISLIPSLIGKPGHKGGNVKFERLFTDIRNVLMGDKKAYCTTFFDYYGLPKNFPGVSCPSEITTIDKKAQHLTSCLYKKMEDKLGNEVARRFIPYVQMHEFEALLFSETSDFAKGIDRLTVADDLSKIRKDFDSPEMINNSPDTAPSKRIKNVVPDYEKPLMGSLAALEIGVDKIREQCALFDQWLEKIEALVDQGKRR